MPDDKPDLTAVLGRLASALDRLAVALDGAQAAALMGGLPAAEPGPAELVGEVDAADLRLLDAEGRELPLPDGLAKIDFHGKLRGA